MRNRASFLVTRWRLAAFLAALLMLMGTAWVAAWTPQTESTEPLETEDEEGGALAVGSLSGVQTLSAGGQDASSPQVAVDATGNAVFVWKRFDGTSWRIQARARSAGGALGAVQTLSAANGDKPQVAVDAAGNAVFVWVRYDGTDYRIQARARSAAGALSAVQNLADGLDPQVAVNATGNAVFVWKSYDETLSRWRIQARARRAAGALSAVQTIASGNTVYVPQVAIDAARNAVFAWRWSTLTAGSRIDGRGRSAAGTLSTIEIISPWDWTDAYNPQVAMDPDGNAVFTWEAFDGTKWRAQARARSAAGTLRTVQTLSFAGQNAFNPQVAIDPNGNAVFTWRRYDGTNFRAQARARSVSGALSAVQTLSAAGQSALGPQVGVDATGGAVFTWYRSDGTDLQIQARARSAAGALSAVQTLSVAGQDAYDPQVAVAADGDAVFVWVRFDGTNDRIQARARSGN